MPARPPMSRMPTRLLTTTMVTVAVMLAGTGCAVQVRRSAEPATPPCPTTAASARPTLVTGPGAGRYRPDQLATVLLDPIAGLEITECGTVFGYQPDMYEADPNRNRTPPTSVSPAVCRHEAEVLQGSAPVDAQLHGSSLAALRFQGAGLGGFVTLMSAPDPVLSDFSSPSLPAACDRFTAALAGGQEVRYVITEDLPGEIGVYPPASTLTLRRIRSRSSGTDLVSYLATVNGEGLAADVFLITPLGDTESEEDAKHRLVADLAVEQWTYAALRLSGTSKCLIRS